MCIYIICVIYLTIYISVYPPISLTICLFICSYIYLSNCLPIYLSIIFTISLSIYQSIYGQREAIREKHKQTNNHKLTEIAKRPKKGENCDTACNSRNYLWAETANKRNVHDSNVTYIVFAKLNCICHSIIFTTDAEFLQCLANC